MRLLSNKAIKFLAQRVEKADLAKRIKTSCDTHTKSGVHAGEHTKTPIVHIYELSQKSRREIRSMRGLSYKSLHEIEELLEVYDLYLNMTISELDMEKIQKVINGEKLKPVKPLKDRMYKALVISQYIDGDWVELITIDVGDVTLDSISKDIAGNSTCVAIEGKEGVVVSQDHGPVRIKEVSKVRPKD